MRLGRLFVRGFRACQRCADSLTGRANKRTRSINENGAEARHSIAIEWRQLGTEVVDDEGRGVRAPGAMGIL